MAFKLDNNTILLIVVVTFLAYYIFSDYKEGFKPQRGVSRSSRGLSKKGAQIQVVAAPVVIPPPTNIQPVVVAPPPPPPIVVSSEDADFAGLL